MMSCKLSCLNRKECFCRRRKSSATPLPLTKLLVVILVEFSQTFGKHRANVVL